MQQKLSSMKGFFGSVTIIRFAFPSTLFSIKWLQTFQERPSSVEATKILRRILKNKSKVISLHFVLFVCYHSFT